MNMQRTDVSCETSVDGLPSMAGSAGAAGAGASPKRIAVVGAGIAGLAAGIAFVRAVTPAHIAGQERRLVHELARALSRESKIECFAGKEQTGVLSFRVPGTPSEVLADMLSDEGVCTRAGLHCAPLAHRTAGTEDTGTVRLSLSFYSTARQLEQAADKVCRLVKKL